MSPWGHCRISAAIGLALSLSPFALADDVEHQAIVLPAPSKPKQPKPQEKKTPPKTPVTSPVPRYPSLFAGPRKIKLEGGFQFVAPEKKPEISEEDRVKGLLSSYLADLRAGDLVHSGHYDQAWIELTRRIEHYWTPSFDQILESRISQVSGAWLADMAWKTLRGWYVHVQLNRQDTFARPQRMVGDAASVGSSNVMDLNRDAITDDSYGSRVLALIEIRFGSDGEHSTEIAQSSGHPLFDKAAIKGVQKALENKWGDNLPRGPVRTIIAMEGHFTILPPLPVVGFTFDEMLGLFDTIYPFKKIVRGKAYLVAIYKDPKKAKSE